MRTTSSPELLAPAGTLDAVRAAVANGANAVYLGASMYNARDDGAQLSLDELAIACAVAHARGVRVYLTFNVLIKQHELIDALRYLGECIDRGIDAAIVQDLGVVRLIQRVYPQLEIHGSTQMTIHDVSGAQVMERMGVERVVLARENTLSDIAAIRSAVPGLGLETFIHGALCISYSGQCFMSGMISERSANRGSCAQSCRKDYTLTDEQTKATLDSGFLISAKDLAAHDHLAQLAALGVGCFKVEGRKKKPEYVATVTHAYREWLDRIARGDVAPPPAAEIEPLVQIFSRGNTGGMYGGREGREYITRDQPDNRGLPIGIVVGQEGHDVIVDVSHQIAVGDGIGFEPPVASAGAAVGGTVQGVRQLSARNGRYRQALTMRVRAAAGWRVVRSSDAALLATARGSFADVQLPERVGRVPVHVRVFGHAGGPLKTIWQLDGDEVTIRGETALAPASNRALDNAQLRAQLGRLGETAFVLGTVDESGLSEALFLPVSELNRIRQAAVDALDARRQWTRAASSATREAAVTEAVQRVPLTVTERTRATADVPPVRGAAPFALRAIVHDLNDARRAASSGATEVVFDPFVRHPAPPRARVRALHEELTANGVSLRLRTPTIVRPDERKQLDAWLALGLPLLSGHLGLVASQSPSGVDTIADYATNAFNAHTAALLFELGAARVTASIELTLDEIGAVVAPWHGDRFDVVVYGRPEGMTIEHCVLSAAFDRKPTTCRDLCVQKHTHVSITDPAGYTFAVATDSACRNRLLHSRPIDATEFLPVLWRQGLRGFHMLFNVPHEPIEALVRNYRNAFDALAEGRTPDLSAGRHVLAGAFTRGHFVRPV